MSRAANNGPEAEHFSEPAGLIFSKFGIIAVVGGLLLFAWAGLTVIVILLALILAAAALTIIWSRLSLVGVRCERSLSDNRVFPGEKVDLKLRLVNRKLLPLPWVQVDDEIPAILAPGIELPHAIRPGRGILSKGSSLLWYSSVTWKQPLTCNRRGFYRIGPLTVTSGDIFGFYPRYFRVPRIENVIVYPRLFPITHLDVPSFSPVGDTKAYRRIFEDPIRVIGVRDYTPHDGLRRIHWKATARHQKLQVKVFEPTTALKVALFLAIDSFRHDSDADDENFELGISTVASLADYLVGGGNPVGLFANTRLADSGEAARLLPGSGTDKLLTILELLAKVTSVSTSNFVDFLHEELKGLTWGTTLIIILSKPSESLLATIDDLKRGHRLLVYQVGAASAGTAEANGWNTVLNPADLYKVGPREAS